MNPARAFESYWAEVERPGRPAAESLPPRPELAGVVATATALRRSVEAIPAVNLDALWLGVAARLDMETLPAWVPAAPKADEPRETPDATVAVLRPPLRWTLRVAAAAVAAAVALATVSLHARPGSALYPVRLTIERTALALSPRDGSIHLRVAEARLGDLLVSLRMGPVRAAPGLARSLVVNRAAAGRAGADLTDLDLRIALEVPPALSETPSSIAASVRTILGDLLPPEEPSPAQGPAAAPETGEGTPSDKQEPAEPGRHQGSGHDADDQGGEQGGKQEGHEGEDEGSGSLEGSDSHEDSNGEGEPSGPGERSSEDGGPGDREASDD
ncbi:MAG TPA: hypothetical protein VEQ37_14825 [Actinomycetota bacterium]|nr:hypothetical protein [Actinomycetota bacterium]